MKRTPQETHDIKLKCKALHLQGYNAKQVSQQTGVTEKTMGLWIKKHGWKNQKLKELDMPSIKVAVIDDLKKHIISLNPSLYKKVEPVLNNYLLITK